MEAKLGPQAKQRLQNIAKYINQLGHVEEAYLWLIHGEEVCLRDGYHPFCLEVDVKKASDAVNGEYLHPINYFLQQEGMGRLWRNKAGVGFGGSAGGAGQPAAEKKAEAKKEEPKVEVVGPTEPESDRRRGPERLRNGLEAQDHQGTEEHPEPRTEARRLRVSRRRKKWTRLRASCSKENRGLKQRPWPSS